MPVGCSWYDHLLARSPGVSSIHSKITSDLTDEPRAQSRAMEEEEEEEEVTEKAPSPAKNLKAKNLKAAPAPAPAPTDGEEGLVRQHCGLPCNRALRLPERYFNLSLLCTMPDDHVCLTQNKPPASRPSSSQPAAKAKPLQLESTSRSQPEVDICAYVHECISRS